MKWGKVIVALGLFAPLGVWVLYVVLALVVGNEAWSMAWRSLEVRCFGGGFLLFCLGFFLFPRPMWFYVFGHELTHAVWIWLFGGRVSDFRVSSRGGMVKSDRVNFVIALAPYFFPIYSFLAAWLWWLASFWVDLRAFSWLLYALLGVTWAFHLCFTALMIPTVQSDITSQGWIFSLSWIFLANVVLFALFLIWALPEIGWLEVTEAARRGTRLFLIHLQGLLSIARELSRPDG